MSINSQLDSSESPCRTVPTLSPDGSVTSLQTEKSDTLKTVIKMSNRRSLTEWSKLLAAREITEKQSNYVLQAPFSLIIAGPTALTANRIKVGGVGGFTSCPFSQQQCLSYVTDKKKKIKKEGRVSSLQNTELCWWYSDMRVRYGPVLHIIKRFSSLYREELGTFWCSKGTTPAVDLLVLLMLSRFDITRKWKGNTFWSFEWVYPVTLHWCVFWFHFQASLCLGVRYNHTTQTSLRFHVHG